MAKKRFLEEIIYGKDFQPEIIKIDFVKYIKGYAKSLKVRKIFKREGFRVAADYVSKIPIQSISFKDETNAVYNARRIITISNKISKTLFLSWKCLENSLALSAILLVLGYEHTLLIGKKRNFMGGDFLFHAWLEHRGTPINDISGIKEMVMSVYEKDLLSKVEEK